MIMEIVSLNLRLVTAFKTAQMAATNMDVVSNLTLCMLHHVSGDLGCQENYVHPLGSILTLLYRFLTQRHFLLSELS